MKKRNKELALLVEAAGLVLIEITEKNSRIFALCEAPNGVQREFSISNGGRCDARADLNEQARMKRFARTNPAPATETETQPTTTMVTTRTPKEQPTAATLGPRDFYKLCEWLKAQDLNTVANFDGLRMLAERHVEGGISEPELREAMDVTGTRQPEAWSLPTDPVKLVAYELVKLMQRIGETPPHLLAMLPPLEENRAA